MKGTRDRLLAVVVVGLLGLVAIFLVALLREAQFNAVESREQLRLEHVEQLARSMDARVTQAYTGVGALLDPPGSLRLVPNDPADAARLRSALGPNARVGIYLVDAEGTIVNGVLLRDPAVIGQPSTIEGLDLALRGTPSIAPVGPALTTTSKAIGILTPLRDASGRFAGAMVFESEVAADSAFAREVAELRTGSTGRYSFVDQKGIAIASSDEQVLGRSLDLDDRMLRAGFHREGERVAAVADVPSARWKVVFEQSVDEFEGDLTGPLGRALGTLVLGAVAAGAISVFALLRRLRAAREEQRRLAEIAAAREEFTSIVSHELRTPVAGLLGFLETTVDHWDDMDEASRQRSVRRAYANARTLRSLTSDVLDASAIDAGALTIHASEVDLRSAVLDAVESARDGDPDRPITVNQPEQPILVIADAVRLTQIVVNLLDNADKSSPAVSPIDVTVSVDDEWATVQVHDRGSGIAPEDRERIFERFVRGRGSGSGRGSGLGLYIARTLVEAHGGRIWAADGTVTDGGAAGALVSFTLPLAPPPGGGAAGLPS